MNKEKAYWLADKIPAYGDYAKEAAQMLRKQADQIERLNHALRHHIRVYRVADEAWDPEAETDRLMAITLETNHGHQT